MEDMEYKVAQRIMELYVSYRKDFVWMDKKGNTFRPRPQRMLTIGEIMSHLDGGNTVSVLANERSTVFLCFDVDVRDRELICAIRSALIDIGIPDDYIYISTSGGKGYHIEVFFDGEVWNTRAMNLFDVVFDLYGIDKAKVECMPTARHAIKLPLGVNHKTGNRCWYINKDTFEPIEDYEYIFRIKRFSTEKLDEILHEKNKILFLRDLSSAVKPEHASGKFSYKLPVITKKGQRHKMMCSVGMHYRICGLDESGIYHGLLDWVDKQDRSLIDSSDSEIERDAMSIVRSVMKLPVKEFHDNIEREMRSDVTTYITDEDAEHILCIESKSYRKVAFLLLAFCRRFNPAILSYDQMSEITGLSRQSVMSAVKEITANGLIRKKDTGGIKKKHGKKCRMANEYCIDCADSNQSKYITTIQCVRNSFDKTYYQAMFALVGNDRLKETFTRNEYKEWSWCAI